MRPVSRSRRTAAYVIDVPTPAAYIRPLPRTARALQLDTETFEKLLDTARRLRKRRRDRLVRLGLLRPRAPVPSDVDVRAIRLSTGLSQAKFAELLSIEVSTLRNWEQGRREPTGPARALLRAIRNNPVDVIKALSG